MKERVNMEVGVSRLSALEASEGERSEPERDERALKPVEPEVLEKPVRRKFTAEYKLRVLQEAERCPEPGQIGALLRREGLYSSNLTAWRRQRERGALDGLAAKKRGRKAKAVNPLEGRVGELQRENKQLRRRLKKAEIIIEFQKKVSEILGIPLKGDEEGS